MKDFKGKAAVVTGAASGIGRALARHAVSLGMNVALVDRNGKALERLQTELQNRGARCLMAMLDVSDRSAMEDLAKQCIAEFGSVECLFNNAGILDARAIWQHSDEEWQRMLNVNVMGVVNGIQAFLPSMMASGSEAHIVNTGSIGSLVAAPAMGQYTACKMAVRGITECLHYDLQAENSKVSVSLLCPGPVSTEIAGAMMGQEAGEVIPESDNHPTAGMENFLSPEACAEITFEAIKADRFWVFTHDFGDHYRGLSEAIARRENPVYEEVQFA